MKKSLTVRLGIILIVIIGLLMLASQFGPMSGKFGGNRINLGYQSDTSDAVSETRLLDTVGPASGAVTEEEKAGLVQMREEEKLAHDVYIALGEKWGLPIFANIARSEQNHTDAVKTLLDRYGIADPSAGKGAGEFSAPAFTKLYIDLVAKGQGSLVDALTIGATVEDLDIHDLNVLKAQTTKEDILFVYNNLQKGSRNHTRAFVGNLQTQGATFSPQYMSQAELDSIMSSSQERGPQI